MRKILFFLWLTAILFFLWAHQAFSEDKAVNPASNLPSVPVAPLFELRDFSGGLNLKAPTTELAGNEALTCQNWLFDRERGLVTRPGFSKVNSAAIDLNSPWGLYHYSIPNYGKGFLVGDSTYIYKMTDAGTFADSQIYSPLFIRIGNTQTKGTVIEPQDKWLVEKTIFRNDEVLLFDGTNSETLVVNYVVYNPDTARYQIDFTQASNRTISTSTSRSYARIRTSINNRASLIQRNNTVIIGTRGHQALLWDGFIKQSLGFYAQGTMDTVYIVSGTDTDTAIVCNKCNFTTDELVGKVFSGTVSFPGAPYLRSQRIITSNTNKRIYWREVDSAFAPGNAIFLTTTPYFTIWSPVFTVLDSGAIDSVYQGTGANQSITNLLDNGKTFDNHIVGGRVIEFLTGPARGLLRVLNHRPGGAAGYVQVYRRGGLNYDEDSRPRPGDKYAIYEIGLSAALLEFYYDRLVAAGMDFFPNTIIYSAVSEINNFSPSTDVLVLPEQGGDSIMALVNTGNLTVFQKHRIWTLIGPPPWTGQTVILSSDGVGCIAPRSIVKDGNYLYFVGLRGNIPTVFRRDVSDLSRFVTASGGSIFEGEGPLLPLTTKIDPLMMKVNRSKFDKISAGLFGEHLLVSLPFGTSAVNDSTIAINIRTGAIGLWTLAGGLWHNGRAAGDSGQVYFTSVNDTGWVYLFGGATDSLDLGATFTTLYQSGWLDFGAPTIQKQGLRLWAQQFRSSTSGSALWNLRTDFTTTNQHTFTTSTTTGERDENSYIGVAAIGKRFGLRFEGSGLRGSFVLKGLTLKLALRGETL